MEKLSFFAVTALAMLASACGGAQGGAATVDPDPHSPRNLYPLLEGSAWSYDVDTGTAETMLAVTRVSAVVGDRVEVNSGTEPVVYELRAGGIFRPQTETWLLKAPIAVGASWPSKSGMTATVESISERVATSAGSFDRCVRVEERGGDRGQEITTIYCPRVGPAFVESRVALTTSEMPAKVSAKLRGFQIGLAP
jgi:hypothetical protein